MPSETIKVLRMDMKISKVCVKIDPSIKSPFQLQSEGHAKIQEPINSENRTALLLYTMKLFMPDSDIVDIQFDTNTVVEFDRVPEDYMQAGKDCLGELRDKIYTKLDEILDVMGYSPLDLSAHIDSEQGTKE